jgi:ABC-type glycerol-3-phosphate transport system substrate-binding protein
MSFAVALKETTLSIAVLAATPQQVSGFSQQFTHIDTSLPKIKIKMDFYSDQGLKNKLADWLENGKYDLIHWQAGKRLEDLVNQELIQPIDTLIPESTLTESLLPQVLKTVQIDGHYQGLPFAYYPWGFYYNKAIFVKHGLSAPDNWSEFLALCAQLKSLGISPLVQANQEQWPALAWLDYLALDNGGPETHKQMSSFTHISRSNVTNVLTQFSPLVENGYFFAPEHNWTWPQSLTVVLREQAAMTMMGLFAESAISPENSEQLGYFPFPYQNKQYAGSVVAPIDVFIVPKASQNLALMPQVLAAILKPATSAKLAKRLGFISVRKADASPDMSPVYVNDRTNIALEQLRNSRDLVPFFDRQAEKKYADNIANGIIMSIAQGEPSAFKEALLGEDFIQPNSPNLTLGSAAHTLNFSTLTGDSGTFFVSNMMRAVYYNLGYRLTVNRYSSLEESLLSYQSGADGELARVFSFTDYAPDLIRVPESLAEAGVSLICKDKSICEEKLMANTLVGISSEMLITKNWLKKEQARTRVFSSTSAMIKAYQQGIVSTIVLTDTDIAAHNGKLKQDHIRQILRIPVYHFIHNRHRAILSQVNQQILAFKKTAEYQQLKSRFSLK